jgi:hypothetical protein
VRALISVRTRISRLLPALGLSALLAACAGAGVDPVTERPGDLPAQARVSGVPFVGQQRDHCGPAALAMLLRWSGAEVTQAGLADRVFTPGKAGTLRTDLLTGARRQGRLAVPIAPRPGGGDGGADLRRLLTELAAGHPVLVFQNLSLDLAPQWHFAVAVGYDLPARELVLHSGRTERKRVSLDSFARTWARGDRWAMLALRPGTLPASADRPAPLVEAAAGLERAQRPEAAARAYAAILQRWPDSFAAAMGRGNALYAQDRPEAAARAFRRAIDIDADAPAAWNNLAYAERARGRGDAARSAARRAVRLAERAGLPPDELARFRDTLRDMARDSGGGDAA